MLWLVLLLGIWLLFLCDSKTSLIGLLFGLFVLTGHKFPVLGTRPRMFLFVCLATFPLGYALDQLTGFSEQILDFLGRNRSLTGRTDIWEAAFHHPVNPLIGGGYLMYWDVVGEVMIKGDAVSLKTAHNGYLDMYLDGGFVMIGLFSLMAIQALNRLGGSFLRGDGWARIGLAIFLVLILVNVSESVFFRRSPLWFAFLLFCVDYRRAFARGGNPQR
jgi:O-antigen ligase